MEAVNMHEAKSRLSQLVEAVESGATAEVVIARNGKPAARLVAIAPSARDTSRRLGVIAGKYRLPESIDRDEDTVAALFNDGKP